MAESIIDVNATSNTDCLVTTVRCRRGEEATFLGSGFVTVAGNGPDAVLTRRASLDDSRGALEAACRVGLQFLGSCEGEEDGVAFLFAAVDGVLHWAPAFRSDGKLQPLVSYDGSQGEAAGLLEALTYMIAVDRITGAEGLPEG